MGLATGHSPGLIPPQDLLAHFDAALKQQRSDVPIREWDLRKAGLTAAELLAHIPPGPWMVRHHPDAGLWMFTRVRR